MRRIAWAIVAVLLFSVVTAAQQTPPTWQAPPPSPDSLRSRPQPFNHDRVEFVLQPTEGMEYKYRHDRQAGMLFSWSATGPVHYELHSVPDGAPSTFAETFDKQDDRRSAHGSYLAPFTGIHGWYWQNRTNEPVTITLTASGFFTDSQEFRRGQPPRRKTF